jgi:hypothetical protein
VSEVDSNFIINLKLGNAGLHLKELAATGNSEIYKAYRDSGGMIMQSPLDTHYVMDGAYVIFIGNKHELLGFVNSNF